jgi:hypothetical protein
VPTRAPHAAGTSAAVTDDGRALPRPPLLLNPGWKGKTARLAAGSLLPRELSAVTDAALTELPRPGDNAAKIRGTPNARPTINRAKPPDLA